MGYRKVNVQKMIELLNNDLTLREVGNEFGVSYEAIRRLRNKYYPEFTVKCRVCDVVLKKNQARYCSKDCKDGYKLKEKITYACIICETETTRPKMDRMTMTCSEECSWKANRQRRSRNGQQSACHAAARAKKLNVGQLKKHILRYDEGRYPSQLKVENRGAIYSVYKEELRKRSGS